MLFQSGGLKVALPLACDGLCVGALWRAELRRRARAGKSLPCQTLLDWPIRQARVHETRAVAAGSGFGRRLVEGNDLT
jgi:hypothetical protein